MSKWVLLRADGGIAQQIVTQGGKAPSPERDNPEGLRAVRVKRFGKAGERLDADGNWETDPSSAAAAIDAAHRADHGPFAKALEHAMKTIEARFILGTLESGGLIAREAAATGKNLRDLAQEIAERGREGVFEKAIVDRRRRKAALKGDVDRG